MFTPELRFSAHILVKMPVFTSQMPGHDIDFRIIMALEFIKSILTQRTLRWNTPINLFFNQKSGLAT